VLLTAGLVTGLVVVINGPWLRVAKVSWVGQRYSASYVLDRFESRLRGTQLMTVDGDALAADLKAALPSVAAVRVQAELPDRVRVTLVEQQAAFTWRTSAVQLICAKDGTVIGEVALRSALPDDLARLPNIDDRRVASRNIIVGDRIDTATMTTALRLAAVVPAALGSAAAGVAVRIDDAHGFLLVARGAPWQIAFGGYTLGRSGSPEASTTDEIEAQVAAVRTLFSLQPETAITWVDARNPGKVYWRP